MVDIFQALEAEGVTMKAGMASMNCLDHTVVVHAGERPAREALSDLLRQLSANDEDPWTFYWRVAWSDLSEVYVFNMSFFFAQPEDTTFPPGDDIPYSGTVPPELRGDPRRPK